MNTSTAFVSIQDQIVRLQADAKEAKNRGEFEYVFMLLDRIESLQREGGVISE